MRFIGFEVEGLGKNCFWFRLSVGSRRLRAKVPKVEP